ncbi:MAG: radical SAM protein, partial [Bacteroidales bacterium]|nr:radical SAM protein [Bacteroidales bacterium]
LSQYNYFVEHEDRTIYFNGMTGATFSLSNQEHQKISFLFEDLISFHIQYESIFNKFKEWGFILNEDVDEVDQLRLKNRLSVFADKTYRLTINPTEDCVFNCWYCVQHTYNRGGMSKETVENIKKHIEYMVKEEKITGIFLDWFGGEPLMYFDEVVYPISKYALETGLPVTQHITTNAYLIDKEMVEKMKEIKLNSFQITIDGDEKRHNKIRNVNGKPSYSRIMENIHLILEYIPNAVITLRINYDDVTLNVSNMDSVLDAIKPEYRKQVCVNLQRVRQTIKPHLMQENKTILNLGDSILKKGYILDMTGPYSLRQTTKCYADRLYYAVINYDGKIYKCTVNMNREAGILTESGKIIWDQDILAKLYGTATFENEKCLACKLLPMCLGTCTQSGKTKKAPSRCLLDISEVTPENYIIKQFQMKIKKEAIHN